ncbi:hypothetical protein TNCV_4612511 [Trichonephila clavipes]|nr:hypothetical protein TNCV_4612511 [Trichonephila clavipes]
MLFVRKEVASILSKVLKPSPFSVLFRVFGIVAVGLLILELHPVRGQSRGFLAVSKFAGTRPRNILRVKVFIKRGYPIHKKEADFQLCGENASQHTDRERNWGERQKER